MPKFVYFHFHTIHHILCILIINSIISHHTIMSISHFQANKSYFIISPKFVYKLQRSSIFTFLPKIKLPTLIVPYQTYMLHLSPSSQKTSHNIIISLKKIHHSIISNSYLLLIQSLSQINKTNFNPSKLCSNNYINQNSKLLSLEDRLGTIHAIPQASETKCK